MLTSIGISFAVAEYRRGFRDEFYICDMYPLDVTNKICHITLSPGMQNVYTYWSSSYTPEALICISCNVLTFPNRFYQNFERLKIINFSNSHLVQLQLTSISHNPFSLQTLDVSRNELETLDGTSMFNYAPKLEHIDLSYNKIYEVAASTFDRLRTPSLFRLDLSYNAIATLEAETFSKLPSLISIKLNNNQLQNVSQLFDGIEMLKYLDLSFNAITALDPDTFSKIFNLEMLNVSSNTLLRLSTTNLIKSNPYLMDLQVNNNRLTDIQAVNAKSLKVLQANGNEIISAHFIGTASLEVLDLSRNNLNVKDFIAIGMDELRVLNLAHNNFTSIRKVTSTLTLKLEILDVSFNQITDLDTGDTLSHLTGLHILNLENSGITSIGNSTFSGLSKLISLDISYNELDTFDLKMLDCQNDLTEIFLDGNKLRNIGLDGLKENLPSLKSMGLSDNAWRCTELSSMLVQLYANGVQIYVEHPHLNESGDNVAGVGCTNDMGTTEVVPVEERTFANNRQHHMDELENKAIQTYLLTAVNDVMPENTVVAEDAIVKGSCQCNYASAVEPNSVEAGSFLLLVERIDKQTVEIKRLSESIASTKNCNVTVDTIEANKLQGPTPRNTLLLSTVWLMGIFNLVLISSLVWVYYRRRLRSHAECHCRIVNEL